MMAGWHQLKNEPFQRKMKSGERGNTAIDSKINKLLTTYRNKDLIAVEKTGNWSELIAKAEAQTRRFRNDFYAKVPHEKETT